MNTQLLFLHALSPLHPGTGQGVGVVDLPVAREQATGLPYLPGSSLKGVLRDHCQSVAPDKCNAVFGPEPTTSDQEAFAGAAQFSDQRLLLLPVRSLRGTFAWVTSPYLLQRLRRDAADAGEKGVPEAVPMPSMGQEEATCVVAGSRTALALSLNGQRIVVLEDLDLQIADEEAVGWAEWLGERIFPGDSVWKQSFSSRFCVIPDDVLAYLLQTALEVRPRIKLNDDSKTVDDEAGALWYEEALPTETILSGLVVATPVKRTGLSQEQVLAAVRSLAGQPLQFGGKATVGRGLCRLLAGNNGKGGD